jgi:hypothetical protein
MTEPAHKRSHAHHPRPIHHTKVLHFFPGAHRLIWVVDGKVVIDSEAWGGARPAPGDKSDPVMTPRRTTPGVYTVHSYGPNVTSTWVWSKIAWGAPLSVDPASGDVLVERRARRGGKHWVRVSAVDPFFTREQVRWRYFQLYGTSFKYDSDHDYVPDIWVFNDFGPMSVRYYKDVNHNGRLDADESLSGEMLHTTPDNEAQLVRPDQTVTFSTSHGCIHMDPRIRESLAAAGAFTRGVTLVVHRYGAKVPPAWNPSLAP